MSLIQYEGESKSHFWRKSFVVCNKVEGKWTFFKTVEQRVCIVGNCVSHEVFRHIDRTRQRRKPGGMPFDRKQNKFYFETSWRHEDDVHGKNMVRSSGVCQANRDDPIEAIVAAYQQLHPSWDQTSVDDMFECPKESEIREDLSEGELSLEVEFHGGSNGWNSYSISVQPVDDDEEVRIWTNRQ